ncbi:MAG: ferrochelatase, partial [Maricaulaceae bacterium]
RHYYDDPRYIAALAGSLNAHIKTLPQEPDVILASYHGLPQSYVDKGDPYQEECIATTDLLRAHMGLSDTKMRATFQSRFGPKAWLQPYTDTTLEALAEEGVKRVVVMTPGFAADCLETLEEIAIEAKETFLEAGGEAFSMAPCLNDDAAHLDLLTDIAKERLLAGW